MLIEKLTQEEARVLGTLLEKSLATPDYYPMTLNALRTACNQKSSREPVTDYADETVASALAGLKRKCLVTFIPYGSQGNQYKYRHFLEDPRFRLGKADQAVLAVLLLRGAQTLNEVRLRASSLHPISGLEEAEALLKALAARDEPLAELLAKRPGWKEVRWRDTLRDPLEEAPGQAAADEGAPSSAPAPGVAVPASGPVGEIEALRREVEALKASHEELRRTVEALKADLYGSKP
jgi:uncharacterized protein YceH (UPF0502 family)